MARRHISNLCLGCILAFRRDSPVVIAGSRRRTGADFVDGVLSLARGLVEAGVRRGDVVAIAALNSDWYIELLLAVAYIGGIAAPLNYRWSLEEARSAMELVKPMMLAVDETCSSWALELQSSKNLPFLKLYVLIGDASPSLSRKRSCKSSFTDDETQPGPRPDPLDQFVSSHIYIYIYIWSRMRVLGGDGSVLLSVPNYQFRSNKAYPEAFLILI